MRTRVRRAKAAAAPRPARPTPPANTGFWKRWSKGDALGGKGVGIGGCATGWVVGLERVVEEEEENGDATAGTPNPGGSGKGRLLGRSGMADFC